MLKRLLPRTLFARALLILITPVLLAQIIATYIFLDRHWGDVSRRLALGFAGDVAVVIATLRESPDDAARAQTFRIARTFANIDYAWSPGAILPNEPAGFALRNLFLDRALQRALNERLYRPFRVDTASGGDTVEVKVQLVDGVLTATTSRKRLASSTTGLFILWMVGTAALLLGVAVVFLRNQLKPIRRLAVAAEAFGRGVDVPAVRPAGAAEVRSATAAFLTMRERIGRQISQRTEMLAGVSHDLKTPLTRMKLQLAMMDGPDVDSLRTDVAEMETMVEGFLAFARGQDAEAAAAIDVRELLRDIAARSDRRRAAVHVAEPGPEAGDEPLVATLRPTAMRRCITNLVDNAARYARHVEIAAARSADQLTITVDDDGPGIPPDQHEAVFRPFVRLDESRNPATGGSGLGLSIARDVARGHGGDVTLATSPLGGLRAQIRVPA